MKELTICPSTLQNGFDTYSPNARKTLFDGNAVSHIFSEASPDTETEDANEAVKSVGRISLSGANLNFPLWLMATSYVILVKENRVHLS